MSKFKPMRLFAFSLILFGFIGWQGYNLYIHDSNYRETRFLFDTEVYVEAHGWGAKKAALEALQVMMELDGKLNKFSSESEIYAINQQAGERPVAVSTMTFQVIEQSLEIARRTNGAFDPAIGPLVKLWGFGEGVPQSVPSTESIHAALRLVDYKKVLLDGEQRTVYDLDHV
ncbi:FAD:protein FMN transferase [Dehalobacter sp.]|uniref:FAD:protein FMN transferase n=1 Tax=Dehalobacter sp. TaxID=1962289 RepID=UPI0025841FA5|nr:FAD:protein FMN transferase [Dehalobacter sp.]MDJ0306634.1 FAD:protein FMN transferase [Dehalobacter sp.]